MGEIGYKCNYLCLGLIILDCPQYYNLFISRAFHRQFLNQYNDTKAPATETAIVPWVTVNSCRQGIFLSKESAQLFLQYFTVIVLISVLLSLSYLSFCVREFLCTLLFQDYMHTQDSSLLCQLWLTLGGIQPATNVTFILAKMLTCNYPSDLYRSLVNLSAVEFEVLVCRGCNILKP